VRAPSSPSRTPRGSALTCPWLWLALSAHAVRRAGSLACAPHPVDAANRGETRSVRGECNGVGRRVKCQQRLLTTFRRCDTVRTMTTTPLRECDKCEGTGWTPPARVTGREMRALRQSRGVSGATVGKAMGVSRAYVSQLELGDSPWTNELMARYLIALDKASEAKR
jgi:hypothetical protein